MIVHNIDTSMIKALSEIDHVYGSIYQKMTLREKISYCEILINTMKGSATKRSGSLHAINNERTNDIINAAKAELEVLTNSINKY
ncbi:MAG: hypothetical protein JNJ40_14105 [Bacteroidia bacterium]|nr:hypothetical protein [Bacteroidia bacterium]